MLLFTLAFLFCWFLCLFLYLTPKIIFSIRKESAIYEEFEQRKILPYLLLLFPVSPVLLILLHFTADLISAAILAAMCFIPALIVARQHIKVFEHSGTSRTDKAQDAARMAFLGAMVGLIYVAVYVILFIVIGTI